jgi:hypothetical protein
VTFRSVALWHQSAQGLHERFGVGLELVICITFGDCCPTWCGGIFPGDAPAGHGVLPLDVVLSCRVKFTAAPFPARLCE